MVGETTKSQHKFVRWEIDEAMKHDIPIVVVNINKKRCVDQNLCPPIIRDRLSLHIGFYQNIIYSAIKSWGDSHQKYKKDSKDEPYHYPDKVYDELLN